MLGPSERGLGGQDAPDGFPASGRNAYPPGANAFFADAFSKVISRFNYLATFQLMRTQEFGSYLTLKSKSETQPMRRL